MTFDPLYQNLLMEHYRHPRNFGKLEAPARRLHYDNPFCGDHLDLYLRLSGQNRIEAIKFQGRGCVLSQASASMMTEAVLGKPPAQARELITLFQKLFSSPRAEKEPLIGDLLVFAHVNDFPSRIPCATLPWQALALCLPAEDDTDVPLEFYSPDEYFIPKTPVKNLIFS